MKTRHKLFPASKVLVLFWLGLVSAHGSVQDTLYPERQKAGTIQTIELGSVSLIVDGFRYHVAPDAHIEIGGSYGAFTMLQAGMKINFIYKVMPGTRREIVRIEQIPDRFRIEQA